MATLPFFVIAFAFTWALQLPAALARHALLPGDPSAYLPLAMLGIFGPMVAALSLTAQEHGRRGWRALVARLLVARVSPSWYVLALLVPGALLSLLLFLLSCAGREGRLHYVPTASGLAVGLLVAFAEEIGWRGYALPRLAARYGSFAGSCFLGVLWTLWHVPVFLAVGVPMALGLVMLLYFVGGSLYFSWLYARSGSLLVVVLAHLGAHLNNSHAALPGDSLPLVVHAVVYASLGLFTMRRYAFDRGPAKVALPLR